MKQHIDYPRLLSGDRIADDHDRRYKYLFSHPGFVERLLTSFVDEPFVKELDFSTLERVNSTFVSEEFARREADVIWKLSFRGRPIYLYLLIEFQSTVDPLMALRFLRYLAELYGSLIAEGQEPPLPAVFPLLLYTGDSRWTAARSTGEMIRAEIPEAFIPQLTYDPGQRDLHRNPPSHPQRRCHGLLRRERRPTEARADARRAYGYTI